MLRQHPLSLIILGALALVSAVLIYIFGAYTSAMFGSNGINNETIRMAISIYCWTWNAQSTVLIYIFQQDLVQMFQKDFKEDERTSKIARWERIFDRAVIVYLVLICGLDLLTTILGLHQFGMVWWLAILLGSAQLFAFEACIWGGFWMLHEGLHKQLKLSEELPVRKERPVAIIPGYGRDR